MADRGELGQGQASSLGERLLARSTRGSQSLALEGCFRPTCTVLGQFSLWRSSLPSFGSSIFFLSFSTGHKHSAGHAVC